MAGFLEKLWDETVAGPTPYQGIGSGSRHDSISIVGSISNAHPKLPVSRSITLLRTQSLPVGPGSDPNSPSCTTPSSPLTPGTPTGDMRFTRKRLPAMEAIEDPRSPTVYDWILISALDR